MNRYRCYCIHLLRTNTDAKQTKTKTKTGGNDPLHPSVHREHASGRPGGRRRPRPEVPRGPCRAGPAATSRSPRTSDACRASPATPGDRCEGGRRRAVREGGGGAGIAGRAGFLAPCAEAALEVGMGHWRGPGVGVSGGRTGGGGLA